MVGGDRSCGTGGSHGWARLRYGGAGSGVLTVGSRRRRHPRRRRRHWRRRPADPAVGAGCPGPVDGRGAGTRLHRGRRRGDRHRQLPRPGGRRGDGGRPGRRNPGGDHQVRVHRRGDPAGHRLARRPVLRPCRGRDLGRRHQPGQRPRDRRPARLPRPDPSSRQLRAVVVHQLLGPGVRGRPRARGRCHLARYAARPVVAGNAPVVRPRPGRRGGAVRRHRVVGQLGGPAGPHAGPGWRLRPHRRPA